VLVGILIPESAQDFHLEALHATGVPRGLVIVAVQVEHAVHDHVRPVRLRRLALLERLGGTHIEEVES